MWKKNSYVEGFPSLSAVNKPERSALQHVAKTSSFSLGNKSKLKAKLQHVVENCSSVYTKHENGKDCAKHGLN